MTGIYMFSNWPLLSLLIWLPVIGGVVVLLLGGDRHATRVRFIALLFALLNVALAVILCVNFDTTTYVMQFTESLNWIPAYGIHYSLGVDGISLPLVLLTVFTTLLVVLASWETVHTKVSQYLATFLIMQGMVIGVFAAMDSMLFYIFWEGMLIPMYLSIGIWGSDNRSYAAIKFFLFTFLGSALMLVAFLYLRVKVRSFNILDLYAAPLSMTVQMFIFLAF